MKSPLRPFALLFTVGVWALCCQFSSSQSSNPPESWPATAAAATTASAADSANQPASQIIIPGPLRSFLRMAAISQKSSSDEIVPLLARNVFLKGYSGILGSGRPKEFLILLSRYVQQARELAALAGPDQTIRIANCQEVQPLLHILGYKSRVDCKDPKATLITAEPERAFLTIDSGFPLPQLEEALQQGKPFVYPYPVTKVPILFKEGDWVAASDKTNSHDLLDVLLRDAPLARLYCALAQEDSETSDFLAHSVGLKKLRTSASVLDFYGSRIAIHDGVVRVPGGKNAQGAWKELVGASPDNAAEFIPRLLTKDKGWLAAYYDGLSRINRAQQEHFTASNRLKLFYAALREPEQSEDAARPTFRPASGLLLLLTRLQWEENGEPHIPGDLAAWKQIFRQDADSRIARAWGKRAGGWSTPDQFVAGMFALSRLESDAGPLQIYLALSDLDARRSAGKRLSPKTVLLMANRYSQFRDQYRVFSEFPELSDTSISQFLNIAEGLGKISNHTLRGNAMGTFQAEIGLWQILARQGQIPEGRLNHSWQDVIKPFGKIASSPQLVDAGRQSLRELLQASLGRSSASQAEIIDLLAGPAQNSKDAQQMHQAAANRIRSVMEGQRLVSLDTLAGLNEGLNGLAPGETAGEGLVVMARELTQFEMPRPIFTSSERVEWASGVYNNSHTDSQMRVDLSKTIKQASSREKLDEARGQLASFYRDTLVGLNYAYYEPPGSQILHNNPLFVRSHDFSGETVAGMERLWQAPLLFGEGSPAGGGAHLVGSLADLPYVLAAVEQDFLTPENVQALICKEIVPGLILSATLPRWWNVSANELHAVALYQRTGEQLIEASVNDEAQRTRVLEILADRMTPRRIEQAELGIRAGHADEVIIHLTPADTFYLAVEFRRRFPSQINAGGDAGRELDDLARAHADEVDWQRLSRDFGVPHPVLAQSYARELLNVELFPAFSGDANRLLAESWDSSNLYWARLADEKGYSPAMLNRLVPELSRDMVEKIAATHFEDWPAMLRAMRETGEAFRQGKTAAR